MGKIVSIVSGKGGVGKTTLTSNLGIALFTHFNKNTLLIDGNLETSHLGLHLGMFYFPITFNSVLKEKADIESAIYYHWSGIKILPASLEIEKPLKFETRKLKSIFKKIKKQADIILVDSSPGISLNTISLMKASDEILIVTNPEISSLIDAKKIIQLADKMGLRVSGIVLNKVKYSPYEITNKTIEEETGVEVIIEIPEEPLMLKSIYLRKPLILLEPDCLASIRFKQLAARLIGKKFKPSPKSLKDEFILKLKKLFQGSIKFLGGIK